MAVGAPERAINPELFGMGPPEVKKLGANGSRGRPCSHSEELGLFTPLSNISTSNVSLLTKKTKTKQKVQGFCFLYNTCSALHVPRSWPTFGSLTVQASTSCCSLPSPPSSSSPSLSSSSSGQPSLSPLAPTLAHLGF